MRKDFNKLLVERERVGHTKCFHDVRRKKVSGLNDEYFGGHESMKKRHSINYNRKSFNENLSPLRGYLRSKIGKSWDKVYSELRKTFDARSVINNHILEHLYDYVNVTAVLIDGKVMAIGRHNSRGYVPISSCSSDYYVCPKDGTLKVNQKKTFRVIRAEKIAEGVKEIMKTFRVVDERTHVRLINGVWYAFDVRDLPEATFSYVRPNVFPDKYRISGFGTSTKYLTWNELNSEQRKKHGVRVVTSGIVYDEFLKEFVSKDPNTVRPSGSDVYIHCKLSMASFSKYYANKRTAPRKMLKALGLDGSAKFDKNATEVRRKSS